MEGREKFRDVMSRDIAYFVKDLRTTNARESELMDIAQQAYFQFEDLREVLDYNDRFDCEDFVDAAFDFLEEGK